MNSKCVKVDWIIDSYRSSVGVDNKWRPVDVDSKWSLIDVSIKKVKQVLALVKV